MESKKTSPLTESTKPEKRCNWGYAIMGSVIGLLSIALGAMVAVYVIHKKKQSKQTEKLAKEEHFRSLQPPSRPGEPQPPYIPINPNGGRPSRPPPTLRPPTGKAPPKKVQFAEPPAAPRGRRAITPSRAQQFSGNTSGQRKDQKGEQEGSPPPPNAAMRDQAQGPFAQGHRNQPQEDDDDISIRETEPHSVATAGSTDPTTAETGTPPRSLGDMFSSDGDDGDEGFQPATKDGSGPMRL